MRVDKLGVPKLVQKIAIVKDESRCFEVTLFNGAVIDLPYDALPEHVLDHRKEFKGSGGFKKWLVVVSEAVEVQVVIMHRGQGMEVFDSLLRAPVT